MGCCLSQDNIIATPEDNFQDIASCPQGNFPGYITRVIDGDTVEAVIELPSQTDVNCCGFPAMRPVYLVRWRVRMLGIDAPELHSRDPYEQRTAQISKTLLERYVLHKHVTINIRGWDKYGGRIVGTLFHDNVNVNAWCLSEGIVRHYNGGRKVEWTLPELRRIELKMGSSGIPSRSLSPRRRD